jgi:hypothetical protein
VCCKYSVNEDKIKYVFSHSNPPFTRSSDLYKCGKQSVDAEARMLDRNSVVNCMVFVIFVDFICTLVDVDAKAVGRELPLWTLVVAETRQLLTFCFEGGSEHL